MWAALPGWKRSSSHGLLPRGPVLSDPQHPEAGGAKPNLKESSKFGVARASLGLGKLHDIDIWVWKQQENEILR